MIADKVIVELQAKLDKYNADVLRASANFEKGMDKIAKSALRTEAQVLRSSTAIERAFKTLGGVMLVRQIQRYADGWTDYSSRVGLAIKSMEAAPAVMDRLYDMAQRTYSAFDQTAESFLGNSTALRELGYSTQQQLDYTEALNNALVISGAKTERAASVTDALAKAMAFGKLQGDNLNTVIQTGGRVAEALAEQLGVGVNQLRNLGKDGKITGDVIYNAMTKRLQGLRNEAEAMPATVADGFQQLGNAVQRYVGTLDQTFGLTGMVAQGMVTLSGNITDVANAAAVAGVALISGYVPALARVAAAQLAMVATNPFLLLVSAITAASYALSAFGGEIQPVAGEMATLHDYAGAAFDAIKDGVAALYGVIQDKLLAAINFITDAVSGVEVSWEDVWDTIKGVSNDIIGALGQVYDIVVVNFTKLPAAIADSVVSAMNAMISGVENGINKVIEAVNRAIRAINSLGDIAGTGSLISEVGAVGLKRLTNSYAGAGSEAAKAYAAAFSKETKDHLGEFGEAWRLRANERAREAATGGSNDDIIASLGSGSSPTRGGDGGSGKRGRGARLNEFERATKSIAERTAAIEAETAAQASLNPLVDDYGFTLEKARAKHDLLTAAQRAGIAITPELEGQIDQLATAYANASVASEQLAESQDKVRRSAQDFANTGKEALSGFISDLRSGVSAAEALANALDRVIDRLLDSALDNLFTLGGNGGGLFSLLGGLFRGGYDEGGYTGAGSKSQPAGVVHKGEVVWSQADIRKAGGVAVVEAMRRGARGYDSGGGVGMSVPSLPSAVRVPSPTQTGRATPTVRAQIGVTVDDKGAIQAYVKSATMAMGHDAAAAGATVALRQAPTRSAAFILDRQRRG